MIAGYDIADFLAWEVATWDRLLSSYQTAIWPAQIVSVLLFVAAIWFNAKSTTRFSHSPLLLVLAASWAWVGLVFHAGYHVQLNWAAHYWVNACLVQTVSLLLLAVLPGHRRMNVAARRRWIVCLVLSMGLIVLTGLFWGRSFRAVSWPLLSPDALAWMTLLSLAMLAAMMRRQWLVWPTLIIPSLVLIVDGLIAYSLPATDRLTIVLLAFVVTAVAVVTAARANYRGSPN